MAPRSNKHKRGNPFLIPTIIQHLTSPEIISESDAKFTLRNLRQLSTLHHQILNPIYFDKVQMYIIINKSRNEILYGPDPVTNAPLLELLESARYMKPLELQLWDPTIFAPTIRGLVLSGNQLNYLLSSKSTRSHMIRGFNPMELILQISPYVTTLKLELEDKHIFRADAKFQLHDFLQHFVVLEKLRLQTPYFRNASPDFNQFETFLMEIDEISKEFGVELVLNSWDDNNIIFLEILLSPERRFVTKNHKLSLFIRDKPWVRGGREIGTWARILTLAKSRSIPVKRFSLNIEMSGIGDVEKNQVLHDLPIISPFVVELSIIETFEEMVNLLFTSCNWPRLKELSLESPTINLVGFSSACPNLEELNLSIIESKSIFTNHELTDKENLNQIFGNCTNTLKTLRFQQNGQYFEALSIERPKIVPGSPLLRYLQELLPNTMVEAEAYEDMDSSVSEEDFDSSSPEAEANEAMDSSESEEYSWSESE